MSTHMTGINPDRMTGLHFDAGSEWRPEKAQQFRGSGLGAWGSEAEH
jgi:hypothetical protein